MIEPADWFEILQDALQNLWYQAPLLLLYVVGIGVALWYWRRQRRVALLTLIGCSLLLVNQVALAVLTLAVFRRRELFGVQLQDVRGTVQNLRMAAGFVSALGFALLLPAIFGWRYPRVNVSWDPD